MIPARARRSLAVLLLAGSMLAGSMMAGVPARADDSGSGTCNGHHAKTDCHIWFRGFPLVLSADVVRGADAWVRTWISLDPDGLVPLVECTANGVGTTCSNGFPDSTCSYAGVSCPWYGSANLFGVYCHAEGGGRWTFRCISGGGQ